MSALDNSGYPCTSCFQPDVFSAQATPFGSTTSRDLSLSCLAFESIKDKPNARLLDISNSVDSKEQVNLPFSFTWFDDMLLENVFVDTNGGVITTLPFLGSDLSELCCEPLPIVAVGGGCSVTVPRISVAQSHLNPSLAGEIWTLDAGSSFIISWEQVAFFGNPSSYINAQVELFPEGIVQIRWGDGSTNGNDVAAGIEDDFLVVPKAIPATGAPFGNDGVTVGGQFPTNQCRRFVLFETMAPSLSPSAVPSESSIPSVIPSLVPSGVPSESKEPSAVPSSSPAPSESSVPSVAPSIEPSNAPSSSPAPTEATYDIDFLIVGTPNSIFQQALEKSKSRWESIITAGLPPIEEKVPLCLGQRGSVDDITICSQTRPIDDCGGLLGTAGPTRLRRDTLLPYAGRMTFDTADIDLLQREGLLDEIILHEMGHVLGIGVLWPRLGLTGIFSDDENEIVYKPNTAACREFQVATTCSGCPPIENDFGRFTSKGHWDEFYLQNEIMTGFISLNDTTNPLSRITIGTMEDMGYRVDYSTAEPLTRFTCPNRSDQRRREAETLGKEKKQRISDKGFAAAVEYGRSVLAKNSALDEADVAGNDEASVYIGDKIVNVLYMEEDKSIFSVVVTA